MVSVNSQNGSEWQRWDLHVHTPFTKLSDAYKGKDDEAIWDEYITYLYTSLVQAFGITDYDIHLPQPEEKAENTRLAFAQQKIQKKYFSQM